MDVISKAEEWARWYHRNQKRRGGKLYFNHLLEVFRLVENKLAREKLNKIELYAELYANNRKVVAFLHDIVEDTDCTLNQIFHEFGYDIATAVDAITKREFESYDDYLSRVAANNIAKFVKLCDIEHNMSDDPTQNQKLKYQKALEYLNK